jgi:glycosyltransferase involved in cell wall biosynthesis
MQSPAHLIVAGTGPEARSLARLAGELGIETRSEFRGHVNYVDMRDLLRTFDVLVLPSRTTVYWKEQFGRVLVEAMACGVVVVGSNSGAIPEVVGDAGIIFPEGNVTALASVLEELAVQPDRRRMLATHGLSRIAQHYSVEHVAGEVLALWRQLAP